MKRDYSSFVLRVLVSLLFLVSGSGKLLSFISGNGDKIVKLVAGIGFPIPLFFAWALLITEIVFGLLVLFGWQTKFTVWPLVFVLVIATFGVIIPAAAVSGAYTGVVFHILAIAVLVHVGIKGPGPLAVN